MKKTEFRALSVQEVVELLRQPAPTLVLFHARPDADAVGSAFALSLWLRAMGSEAYCVCADEVPQHLAFLTKGLQESVLVDTVPAHLVDARVVSVDTASPGQVGALFERYGERFLLMIDHHGTGTPYADHLVLPKAASCGEIVFDLIAASGVDVPPRVSELLYAAIASDTGGFRYSNTTEGTHLRAAALLRSGIDAASLCRQLFETKQLANLRAEKAGFERLHFYDGGRVAILTFPYELQQSMGLAEENLGTLIDVARCVAGVEVAAAIRGTKEGSFRASLRANVDFDVAAVAACFGGGGHVRAAGATLTADTIEQAEQMLYDTIMGRRGTTHGETP
ncbi:MAG: bifunctional oligoribonuclease/PAP phosphatase NrnA [Clostridia bacterium]|nr:bifunctional oligoribonuclease/PAP phosphatase NrnA [Clostridia bacterium]MBQ9801996.1 bifunctional oligoribonuclease/PAP phosphatase NrnA [Clostridia bacterium]